MKARRFNSPSAINTMCHCRRKYFYKYKLNIPEESSIEMIMGTIVHQAIKEKADNHDKDIKRIFDALYKKSFEKIRKTKVKKEDLDKLFQDYKNMLLNWQKDFDPDAYLQCEVPLKSEKYQVMGIIDEILKKNGKVTILDNKTSAREWLSKDQETQLAIYALLYHEKFGKLPDRVGIRFLRTGKKVYIPVNDKLISKAVYECKMMRIKNLPDNIIEYPRNPSPLCNWGKGRCPYFEKCFP